jgi:hypothetical protein
MPNRIIRDGILRSEKVNALEPLTELFYRRLMSVVDDYGRTEAHPTLLRSSCYPLLIDKVDEPTVKNHLKECQKVGLIQLYTVDGKHFIQLINFNQQVRAKVSKFPNPPACTSGCVADAMQMKSIEHLDVDVGGDVDVDECVVGSRRIASHSLAEIPTIDEVKAYSVTIGLVEWKAVDWYHKQEALGWMMNNQRIRKWQPLLTRLRTFWEADGKPLKPPGKASPAPANGAAMPPWARIKTIEASIEKHPGNHESTYSSGKPQDKADFKALRIKLRELKAEQEKEAIA